MKGIPPLRSLSYFELASVGMTELESILLQPNYMQILEIKDKEKWNNWISVQPFSQFLQSWEWGEFHKKIGRKVWRFAAVGEHTNLRECESPPERMNSFIRAGEFTRMNASGSRDAINRVSTTIGTMMLAAQVIKYDLPLGQSYLYCPRGPVESSKFKVESSKLWNLFSLTLQEQAKSERSMFLRIEPIWSVVGTRHCLVQDSSEHLQKVKSVQPENERLLDLSRSEDELLKEMRQKTRYNIRLAEKKGVKVRISKGENDFNGFWELIASTYSRKEIMTHSREYYQGILELDYVKLWIAEVENKIIAANIVSYFGDTATYMHGGADYNYRSLMSPYLLQWETIKDAKMRSYKFYNFGGISGGEGYGNTKTSPLPPPQRRGNSWAGITKFKKGFGGFELNYLGTYEMAMRRWAYKGYKAAKIIMGMGRG